jgi:hypothetical protein
LFDSSEWNFEKNKAVISHININKPKEEKKLKFIILILRSIDRPVSSSSNIIGIIK